MPDVKIFGAILFALLSFAFGVIVGELAARSDMQQSVGHEYRINDQWYCITAKTEKPCQ